MKKYITKYALTKGVLLEECKETFTENMVYSLVSRDNFFKSKREFHDTYEEALREAERMRAKKISNLKKQIEKLEKLEIKMP